MKQVIAMPAFLKAYQHLTPQMQRIVDSKIELLASNPAHPSLQTHELRRAKAEKIRSCYISINKRLIYQYSDNTIYLHDVGEHKIVERTHLRSFKVRISSRHFLWLLK